MFEEISELSWDIIAREEDSEVIDFRDFNGNLICIDLLLEYLYS